MLETEWVLRSLYGFSARDVALAIRRLTGLPNVELENACAVADAISRTEQGIDFADGLHLASIPAACSFVTFDLKLVQKARKLGLNASGL